MEAKELVRLYLKKIYPSEELSNLDLEFLVRYCVNKDSSPNIILKK